MPYNYDVFLSYRNEFPFCDWIEEHFLPFFESLVSNALGARVRVFFDRRQMSIGDAWPERLQHALVTSKCLVAIWSPNYFCSEWCRRECEVMIYRERRLGFRTDENPTGLVLPVNVFDGEYFPEIARNIEWVDCKKYARIGEGFKKTPLYVDFQDAMHKWSFQVAAAIRHAPRWKSTWSNRHWLKPKGIDLQPRPMTRIAFPALE